MDLIQVGMVHQQIIEKLTPIALTGRDPATLPEDILQKFHIACANGNIVQHPLIGPQPDRSAPHHPSRLARLLDDMSEFVSQQAPAVICVWRKLICTESNIITDGEGRKTASVEYHYDEDGESVGRTATSYASTGNPIGIIFYDSNGLVSERIVYDESGDQASRQALTYDEDGKLVKTEAYDSADALTGSISQGYDAANGP